MTWAAGSPTILSVNFAIHAFALLDVLTALGTSFLLLMMYVCVVGSVVSI
jgi:hypothetical protein